MAETRYYHLHLTDSDAEKFLAWREAMNGTEASNMVKIDAALYEKERVVISAEQPEGLTENDTWLEEVG